MVSWFLICGSLFFLAVFIVLSLPDLVSSPLKVPLFVWMSEVLFVGCFAIGVYYKTLKVLVNDTALKVSSLFGHRVIALNDIASVVIYGAPGANARLWKATAFIARKRPLLICWTGAID